jgi:hypothetical protein
MRFLILALLAIAACSKDDKPKPPPAETSFNVSHGSISVDAKHK